MKFFFILSRPQGQIIEVKSQQMGHFESFYCIFVRVLVIRNMHNKFGKDT